jgi:hypothetical protein
LLLPALVTLLIHCSQRASKHTTAALEGDRTIANSSSSSSSNNSSTVLEVCHTDIIGDTYWLQHPHLLQLQSNTTATAATTATASTSSVEAVSNGMDKLDVADSDQQTSTTTAAATTTAV